MNIFILLVTFSLLIIFSNLFRVFKTFILTILNFSKPKISHISIFFSWFDRIRYLEKAFLENLSFMDPVLI